MGEGARLRVTRLDEAADIAAAAGTVADGMHDVYGIHLIDAAFEAGLPMIRVEGVENAVAVVSCDYGYNVRLVDARLEGSAVEFPLDDVLAYDIVTALPAGGAPATDGSAEEPTEVGNVPAEETPAGEATPTGEEAATEETQVEFETSIEEGVPIEEEALIAEETPVAEVVSEDAMAVDAVDAGAYPAFSAFRVVDGVKVAVEASEGAFPDGATLFVSAVDADGQRLVDAAVAAERDADRNIAASPMVHAVSGGSDDNYTNARSITLNVSKVSLKAGGSKQLKATVKGIESGKKVLSQGHAALVRYYSSNKAVATVNASGKIKAVGKGTCLIYALTPNGICKKVKVTVK